MQSDKVPAADSQVCWIISLLQGFAPVFARSFHSWLSYLQMEDQLPRKLAAILYADVADYSGLTGEDEEATHRRLSEPLDLVSNSIGHHKGKVVHYAGDAVLADFAPMYLIENWVG